MSYDKTITEQERGSVEFTKTTESFHNSYSSVTWTVLIMCSYRVRAGELAGDVECNEVFPNNYIRHTITIIGNLGTQEIFYHCLSSGITGCHVRTSIKFSFTPNSI